MLTKVLSKSGFTEAHTCLVSCPAKIELIEAIGTEKLGERSKALYGYPSADLLRQAQEKLAVKPKHFEKLGKTYSMKEAIVEFEKVLKDYGLDSWKVKVKEHMVTDVIAGKKNVLFVREGATFDETRLRMLVAHEIETHILTAENGARQSYLMFNRGFGNYLETQEGLAIWNQESVITHDVEKNYRSAVLVFVIDFAMKHGFAETVDYCKKLGMKTDKAFRTAIKVKRGYEDTSKPGAFTKDMIYFSGYLQIQSFVAGGGDLRDLYFGKYNLKDLQHIKDIPNLHQPYILPKFLSR